MKRKKTEMRPANLFFIELTIALLFFALSAAVIMRVFAAADSRQHRSMLTERTVICAQSVAEAYSVSGDVKLALVEVFGENVDTSSSIQLDGSLVPSENGEVSLIYSEEQLQTEAGTLKYLDLCFRAGEKELISLRCSAYISMNGGAADE